MVIVTPLRLLEIDLTLKYWVFDFSDFDFSDFDFNIPNLGSEGKEKPNESLSISFTPFSSSVMISFFSSFTFMIGTFLSKQASRSVLSTIEAQA